MASNRGDSTPDAPKPDPPEADPLAPDLPESDPLTPDPPESDPLTPDSPEPDPSAPDPPEPDPSAPDPPELDPPALPEPTAAWTPAQIKALGEAQKLTSTTAGDRTLMFRQMHMAVILILGGCALAVLGLVLVKETDATKLTAIVSLGTAVIGAGAALLPTGAAAGAAARILSRDLDRPSGGG